jgi:serine/threonine-protein kinase
MLELLLGNYRVVGQLGEGGMGVVYLARHEALGRRVAVKVLQPELSSNGDLVRRFFNEAQAATAIDNPGIVQIFDYGTTADGRAYIVMELLEGQTLTARLKQRRLDAEECCRMGRQIANVLQAAHERGITHRDLKPDNLFLVRDSEVTGGVRVKVLDFGIAKLAGELHAAGVKTRTGVLMGTPDYMSPEQCRSALTAEPRSDIYSLGCILFEMVCGRPPFVGEGLGSIIGAHLYTPPPHPQSLAPDLPDSLAQMILHLLAKHPGERPQTMSAVSQRLDEILRSFGAPSLQAPTPLMVPDPAAMPTLVSPPPPREATPCSRPSLVPPLTPSPPPLSSPRLSPVSTTLGGSVGMSEARPRSGGRRLPWVFGGIIGVVMMIAIMITFAAEPPSPTPPLPPPTPAATTVSQDEIVAGNPGGAAVSDAPLEPHHVAVVVDAVEARSSAATADEVEARCREAQRAKKWAELDQCARDLESLAPQRAGELGQRAVEEIKTARRIARVEAALREQDLKRARSELEQVWPESVEYSSIKRRYESAELQAIADLAARLQHVKDADCEEFNELLAKERASKPARVTVEAARRISCTPMACLAEVHADQGREHLVAGRLTESLAFYEAAYACKAMPQWSEKAFVVACNLGNLARAKLHWKRLPSSMQSRALEVCVRNRITRAMLDAP